MTTISLFDPTSGEVVRAVDARALLTAAGLGDLADAHTIALAEFSLHCAELRSIASEAAAVVGDELISRLDARAKWTLRQDGFEIKTQSPEAGTLAYHTGLLRHALLTLVEDDIISPEGSNAALERVEENVSVPYWMLHDFAKAMNPGPTAAMLNELLLAEPEPRYRQHAAGIKALLKVPAARDLIQAAQVPILPPRRVAKVRRVKK
jgi:hypothetical protein